MYNQPEVALEQYELELMQMTKTRGGYLCDTNKGKYLLKPYSGSMERAAVIAEMLQKLEDRQFEAEEIIYTKEGLPVSKDDGELCYILKRSFQGRECIPKDSADVNSAMTMLASFHAQTPESTCPEYMTEDVQRQLSVWQRHNRELVSLKNYVRTRKNKNQFEFELIRHFDEFYLQGLAVEDGLVGLCSDKCREEGIKGWCHGDYNYHNVVFADKQCHIINFETCVYGVQVADIAFFLRKVMEKTNWNMELAEEMIGTYNVIRQLNEEEYRYLGYYIQYPEKFWKVCNRYYNSNKAWGTDRYMEKLQVIIDQEPQRRAFLEKLFSINS